MKALLLMCLLLTGCGQKGPLYFAPVEPSGTASPATASADGSTSDESGKQQSDQD